MVTNKLILYFLNGALAIGHHEITHFHGNVYTWTLGYEYAPIVKLVFDMEGTFVMEDVAQELMQKPKNFAFFVKRISDTIGFIQKKKNRGETLQPIEEHLLEMFQPNNS